MSKTILDKIVADKKKEVKSAKHATPLAILKERIVQQKPLDFAAAFAPHLS